MYRPVPSATNEPDRSSSPGARRDALGLSAEDRLVQEQSLARLDAAVRDELVAGLEQDEVAHDDVLARQPVRLPVAHDGRGRHDEGR